jgi:hypothetical protein
MIYLSVPGVRQSGKIFAPMAVTFLGFETTPSSGVGKRQAALPGDGLPDRQPQPEGRPGTGRGSGSPIRKQPQVTPLA